MKKTQDGRLLDEVIIVDGEGDELPVFESQVTGFKGLRVSQDPLEALYQEKQFRAVCELSGWEEGKEVQYGLIVPAATPGQVLTSIEVTIAVRGGDIKATLYEDPSGLEGGDRVDLLNKNRNASNAEFTELYYNCKGEGGLPLSTILVGSGVSGPIEKGVFSSWLLKFGSTYRIVVTALSGKNMTVLVAFEIYEG